MCLVCPLFPSALFVVRQAAVGAEIQVVNKMNTDIFIITPTKKFFWGFFEH